MKGKCLCGEVEFEIIEKLQNLYQCHCSLCQKATGASSSFSFVISPDGIKWLSGKDKITSYTNKNGFRTDFCSVCGSPAPNTMNIADYMCVPAGSLEEATDRATAAEIYLDSKASWEKNTKNSKRYPGGPNNTEEFIKLLGAIQA